jgi:hypothetical protein
MSSRGGGKRKYSVCSCVLLFSADDGAGAGGGVDGAGSLDDSLAVDGTAAGAGFAADASDVVPVLASHCSCGRVQVGLVGWRSEG